MQDPELDRHDLPVIVLPPTLTAAEIDGLRTSIDAALRAYGAVCATAERERIQRVLCRYCADGDRPDHGYHWISAGTGIAPTAVVCRAAVI